MSSTQVSFQAKVTVGGQIVPLSSEIVRTNADSQDGVQNGFVFKLDLQPNDPPITVSLGDIIGFIENTLGVGSLAGNPGIAAMAQFFPGIVSTSNFTPANPAVVEIKSFAINSTAKESLFSFSVDIEAYDPDKTARLRPLPAELTNWLSIDKLAIAFTATRSS
jgi:hypothetical protein